MPILVTPEYVEPVFRGLVGVIDVDDGPTAEQISVLKAISTHLWGRDDLDVTKASPLGPEALAQALLDPAMRRRFSELMFTLEMCRHPLTDTQVTRAEQYSAALGSSPEQVSIFRTQIDEGVARAKADFDRYFDAMVLDRTEPSYRTKDVSLTTPDPELIARVEAMHDLPADTLGYALAQFHVRYGFSTPGTDVSPNTYLYLAHDMIHVISGIAPSGPGEIALGGFQMAMNDNSVNTFSFLSPMVIHEAGISTIDDIVSTEHTLARPGAADLLGSSLARGAQCTGDFAFIDHLAVAHLPLEEVRAKYGVVPPDNPDDGNHYW